MKYFDIHGFTFSVDDNISKIFDREYGWASKSFIDESDLCLAVRKYKHEKELPTKPIGCHCGLLIPFGKTHRILWYNANIPTNFILSHVEGLFWWPDKTLMHSAGVTKDGLAFLFTGPGNVGKTSIVLRLLGEGYDYLGDDWLVVGNEKVYPLPKTIRVFDYNLNNPDISKKVLGFRRFFIKPYIGLMRFGRKHAPHRYLRYGFNMIRPVFNVHFSVLRPGSKVAKPTKISRIFFLERRNVSQIKLESNLPPDNLAERMASVSEFEWNFIRREYHRYKTQLGIFDEHFEQQLSHDKIILENTFRQTEIIKVTIPHGLDLSNMDIENILNL